MTTQTLPGPQDYDIPDHPLAQIFPMMGNEDRTELERAIEENGLREEIVILDGQVIDGRNRLAACKAVGVPARFRLYSEDLDGDPLAYVTDRNLSRRHLTTSQRAAIAAELMDRLKEASEAVAEIGKLGAEGGPEGDGQVELPGTFVDKSESQETPEGTNGSQVPGATKKKAAAKKKPSGKTRDKAAKIMKVSPRSVQKAATLKKQDPAKFADVKAGKAGLNATADAASKKEKEQQAYDTALSRIQAIAGKGLYKAIQDGTRLKRKADVIAYAALSDEDMLRTRHLIEDGWKIADAVKYRARTLSRTHSIQDLVDRATQAGGIFTLEIQGYDITAKKKKAPKE